MDILTILLYSYDRIHTHSFTWWWCPTHTLPELWAVQHCQAFFVKVVNVYKFTRKTVIQPDTSTPTHAVSLVLNLNSSEKLNYRIKMYFITAWVHVLLTFQLRNTSTRQAPQTNFLQ
jgi:hypothetical protein